MHDEHASETDGGTGMTVDRAVLQDPGILLLDEEQVVERGTHDELLAADGPYANRWRVQAGVIESLSEEFLARATERPADRWR